MSIFVLAETTYKQKDYGNSSCELLSNEYLCASRNNYRHDIFPQRQVVNCFQMSIFVLAETTNRISLPLEQEL